MLDTTKPVRTRDGRKASILVTDQNVTEGGGYRYPIRARVEHPCGDGVIEWNYMADGRWKSNETHNHNDLVNERFWHRWLGSISGWTV